MRKEQERMIREQRRMEREQARRNGQHWDNRDHKDANGTTGTATIRGKSTTRDGGNGNGGKRINMIVIPDPLR